MNSIIGYLIDSLEKAKIWKNLNLILISDHGMAKLKDNELILINKYIDMKLLDQNKSYCAEVSNIYPSSNNNVFGLIKLIILYSYRNF